MRTNYVPKALKVKTSFIELVPHKPEVSGSIPLPATKSGSYSYRLEETKLKGKKISDFAEHQKV